MSAASHRGGNDQKLSDTPVGLAPAAQSGKNPPIGVKLNQGGLMASIRMRIGHP